jgi:predicted secreted protein
MPGAIRTQGTILKIGDGADPEVFAAIAQVKAITGPTFDRTVIDVTTLASGGWKEEVGGLHVAGSLQFDINYIPQDATHNAITGLLAEYASNAVDTLHNFKLVFPDNVTVGALSTALAISAETTLDVAAGTLVALLDDQSLLIGGTDVAVANGVVDLAADSITVDSFTPTVAWPIGTEITTVQTVYALTGIVKTMTHDIAVDGVLVGRITIELTGIPTLTGVLP